MALAEKRMFITKIRLSPSECNGSFVGLYFLSFFCSFFADAVTFVQRLETVSETRNVLTRLQERKEW